MTADLTGKTIAFLTDNSGVEQVELTTPWRGLREAGAKTVLIAPQAGEVQAFNQDVNEADTFEAEQAVGDADVAAYDALVIPGGTTNADGLRQNADAVAFVRSFVEAKKSIASICHGPWMLVEAGVLEGRP